MNNTTNTETSATVHPFTRAGLGQAPFRFVGAVAQEIMYGQAVVGRLDNGTEITTKAGGTCAYCGQAIVNMFNVKSADGKVFHVGQDCIAKVYGPTHKITRAVSKVVADRTKARKAARDGGTIYAAATALPREDVRAKLAAQPHPTAYLAAKGETLLGWAEFVMTNGGTSGKLRAARVILKAAA